MVDGAGAGAGKVEDNTRNQAGWIHESCDGRMCPFHAPGRMFDMWRSEKAADEEVATITLHVCSSQTLSLFRKTVRLRR